MENKKVLDKSLTIDELYEKLNAFVCYYVHIYYSGILINSELLWGIVKESKGFYFDLSGDIRISTIQNAYAEDDNVFWVDMSDDVSLSIMCME